MGQNFHICGKPDRKISVCFFTISINIPKKQNGVNTTEQVLEYGSGASTAFFSEFVDQWVGLLIYLQIKKLSLESIIQARQTSIGNRALHGIGILIIQTGNLSNLLR